MKKQLIQRGVNAKDYPCLCIAYYATTSCQQCVPNTCPDIIILRKKSENGYTFNIKHEDGSYFQISYCPWCGINLNK